MERLTAKFNPVAAENCEFENWQKRFKKLFRIFGWLTIPIKGKGPEFIQSKSH